MAEQPNVLLNVTNRAENVLLVREMLSGVALAVRLDEAEANDILTAATEACNNVVLHAYEGEEGPLKVEVRLVADALQVVVRDHGTGIKARSIANESSLGIGLPIIRTLVDRLELRDGPEGGTEVCMEFGTPSTHVLEALLDAPTPGHPPVMPDEHPDATTVAIAPVELARTVLPRILCTLAARAHFSTDRISDTHLVSDALLTNADESLGEDYFTVTVAVEPRNLELHIGPLDAGHANRLVCDSSLDGLGRIVEKLADRHRVASAGTQEMLTLELTDRR
jgi:serine/threonine-protein kinase RsbW